MLPFGDRLPSVLSQQILYVLFMTLSWKILYESHHGILQYFRGQKELCEGAFPRNDEEF